MKPGRDLDALIAEKVMGGNQYEAYFVKAIDHDSASVSYETRLTWPPYSTDIAAAWVVVDALYIHKHVMVLYKENTVMAPSGWYASFDFKYPEPDKAEDQFIWAKTAPHAICLAALKAVGYEFKP